MRTHVTGLKRGKTRVTKSRLFLVLYPIGLEGGASFLLTEHSIKAKPMQSRITLDTQLKITLSLLNLAQQTSSIDLISLNRAKKKQTTTTETKQKDRKKRHFLVVSCCFQMKKLDWLSCLGNRKTLASYLRR